MDTQPMTDGAMRAFLDEPLIAKLATVSARGEVRITPVWFKHEDDGTFTIATWRNTAMVRNLASEPRCSLLIDQEAHQPYYGAHFWGEATVDGPENDVEAITRLYAPYMNSIEETRDAVRGFIESGDMVFVRFRSRRHISWDHRPPAG